MLALAALAAALITAPQQGYVSRVITLRHVDARWVASMFGQPAIRLDERELAREWAKQCVRQVASMPGAIREGQWVRFAAVLPAGGGPTQQVLRLPEGMEPPVAIPMQNSLLVRGAPEAIDEFMEIVSMLDQPAPMVSVELRVEDWPETIESGWGGDLQITDAAQIYSLGNAPGEGVSIRIGIGRTDLLLGLFSRRTMGHSVVAARGTTTSGLPFTLAFGQVLPFWSSTVSYNEFGQRVVEHTLNTVFVGVQFWCLPVVLGTDMVRMTLRPTFSYAVGYAISPYGSAVPVVTYQAAATTVAVPDGHSMVIGGLERLADEVNLRFSGILHQVRNYMRSRPLMIVTPQIIRPLPAD